MKKSVVMLLVLALVFTLMPNMNMGKAYAATTSNETTIYNYITKTKKMNMAAACGMLANLNSESGLRPNNVENVAEPQLICEKTGKQYTDATYTADVNAKKISKKEFAETQIKRSDGSTRNFGYGLCQWTSKNRKMDLYDYAQQYAKDKGIKFDIANLEMQLGFLFKELKESYDQTYSTLTNVPNSESGAYLSAYIMCTNFEIPAYTETTSMTRAKYALNDFWSEYSGKKPDMVNNSYLGICGYTFPTKIAPGKGMSCYGYVVANQKIKEVSAKILDANGKTKYSFSDERTASKAPYYYSFLSSTNKDGAAVDDKMLFSKLTAGSYTYVVSATDLKGKIVNFEKSFKVSSSYSSNSVSFGTTCMDPSTLKVSSYEYPTTLKKGSAYSNKGKITSNYPIQQVTISVLDSNSNSVLSASTKSITYSYDISKLNSKIDFSKLTGGNYTYRVYAKDSKKSSYLIKKTFMVESKKISSANYPVKIEKGKDFTVKGTVTSDLTLKDVNVYVLDSSGKTAISKKVYPNTKKYDISNVNKYLNFGKLAKGTYKYRVKSTDSLGSKIVINKEFSIYTPSTLKISSYNYPTKIKYKKSFSIYGTVKSNYKLKKVKISIINSKSKTVLSATADLSKNKVYSYSLKNLDAKITFGKLPAGKYYYRVYGYDTIKSITLVNKSFTIYK